MPRPTPLNLSALDRDHRGERISRRQALRLAAGGTVGGLSGLALSPRGTGAQPTRAQPAGADAAAERFSGMIVRMRQPLNLEMPLESFRHRETPTEQFYIRNHFPVPTLTAPTYELIVEGHVERPRKFKLPDLQALGQVTRPITLECAGNGRIFLIPQARGLQWGFGGVGTARWTGTPLAAVLEAVGVKPGAQEVIFVGADRGAVTSDPPSPGAIPFDRSIPLAKARQEETLLAMGMNGEPLTPNHGAPLRGLVGGWYGMASIKWLQRIIVTDRPYQGFWQTFDYATYERRDGGLASLTPLTAMLPKAVLASPGLQQVLPVGQEVVLRGAAWAGESAVERVEWSQDGGKTWQLATLEEPGQPLVWTFWQARWTPTSRGPVSLLVRATDRAGRTQPLERDPDRRTYAINHLIPVEVMVQ